MSIPINCELGAARSTQFKVSDCASRVTFTTTGAARAAIVMVYGFVPPDIFSGRTAQLERVFVELVVSVTGEYETAGWHAVPNVEANKQNIIAESHLERNAWLTEYGIKTWCNTAPIPHCISHTENQLGL